ncbi:MAG: 50S ribosomal protein L4 [Thiohalomonadales bacterium]
MEIQLTTATGKASKKTIELSDAAFSRDYSEALVHQVVTAYLSGARSGTRAQKTRSQVRGGGAKPWRQKGTGRARAGTSRSPLWRSGGVTFAAKTKDFSQKVNKKMYRAAISTILSELLRQKRLMIVEGFDVDSHKTKAFNEKISSMGLKDVLIVTHEENENLSRASSNLPLVDVCTSAQINPVILVNNETIIMTTDAVKEIEGSLV